MKTFKIIDTPWNTIAKISCLRNEAIETVVRYYGHNSVRYPEKVLQKDEALALSNAGFKLMVIFQTTNDHASYFSYDKGRYDGLRAYHWAKDQIGQPVGSGIYFAVDYDATNEQIHNNIIPYFRGVQEIFIKSTGSESVYQVGAYGSGSVVNELKTHNLCKYRWLSESIGFNGSREALDNGSYELYQKFTLNGKICNLDVDFDVQNPAGNDMGVFSLSENG